jgi:hypothetical protein
LDELMFTIILEIFSLFRINLFHTKSFSYIIMIHNNLYLFLAEKRVFAWQGKQQFWSSSIKLPSARVE